jgi:sulfate transport system ATP-binding protein
MPDGLQASVQHVHPIGPLVRVELLHNSEIVEVELSREQHEILQLVAGQSVWFRPRQMRVFGEDQALRSTPEKQAFLF